MQKKFENNSFRRLLIINYYEFSLINGIPVRKVNFLMSEYIETSYAIYHLIEVFELYRFHDLFLLRTSILDKKTSISLTTFDETHSCLPVLTIRFLFATKIHTIFGISMKNWVGKHTFRWKKNFSKILLYTPPGFLRLLLLWYLGHDISTKKKFFFI